MLAALALMAALETVPQQDATIEINNLRRTHGLLGPTVISNDVMVGDVLVLMWEMKGLKAAKDGTVRYSLGFEILTGDGSLFYREKAKDLEENLTLGGGIVGNATYQTQVGLDTDPGKYTVKINVEDLNNKGATASFKYEFKVIKQDFSMVRLHLTYNDPDPTGKIFPAPPSGVVGQRLYLHFYVLGFARASKTGNPHFTVKMRVLENMRATVEAPVEGAFKAASKETKLFPITLVLNLNKPGKFTVELTAKDVLDGTKTDSQSFNLTVHPAN